MAVKKTLYEILEVAPTASYAEIAEAHQRIRAVLDSQQAALGREDFDLKMRLVQVAYSTLSSPSSRDGYDAQLSLQAEPPKSTAILTVIPQAQSDAAALRADALLLRAEALSLRADAMGLKAELASGGLVQTEPAPDPIVPPLLRSSARTALLTLGTIAALAMIIKLLLMYTLGQSDNGLSAASLKNDRKVREQEYFQTHGVRPTNLEEAELQDAANRKADEEKRKIEQAKREAEQAQERFVEDSRRKGEQVTAELQYAEERARMAREQEAREKENEASRMRAEADQERQRREAERAKWREVIATPSNN